MNFGTLIDEEVYHKHREALLHHYNGDVVKTTKYLDLHAEHGLLVM